MLDQLTPMTACALISAGVFVVSLLLIFWLRHERTHRDPNASEADLLYFKRQDRRRDIGLAVLLLLAQGFAIAPSIELHVQARPLVTFVVFWLVIFLLVLFLLVLALLDIMATRGYAKRHREAILAERRMLVRQLNQYVRERHAADESRSKEQGTP